MTASLSIADLDIVATNNSTVDGTDVSGATGLVKNGDNVMRSLGAFLARFYDSLGGVASASGTTTLTVTITEDWSAYANGMVLAVKMPNAATAASTLNVTPKSTVALGAKAIRRQGDTAIAANDWLANQTCLFRYDTAYNSAAGAWVLLNQATAGAIAPLVLSSTNVNPSTNNAVSLGSTSLQYSGLDLGNGAAIQWDASGAGITLTPSGNSLVLDNGAGQGGLTIKGNLDLSLGSHGNSGQIVFPASPVLSSGATTLDEYTEFTGTITASFSTAGTSSWAYTTQLIQGTKIGRMVQEHWDFSGTPTIGTGSGNFRLSGSSYTAANSSIFAAGNMNAAWATWPAGRTQVYGSRASTLLNPIAMGAGVATSNLAATNMTTGSAHTLTADGSYNV